MILKYSIRTHLIVYIAEQESCTVGRVRVRIEGDVEMVKAAVKFFVLFELSVEDGVDGSMWLVGVFLCSVKVVAGSVAVIYTQIVIIYTKTIVLTLLHNIPTFHKLRKTRRNSILSISNNTTTTILIPPPLIMIPAANTAVITVNHILNIEQVDAL